MKAILLFGVVCLFATGAAACANCNPSDPDSCLTSDRWPVKTFSDEDAALVSPNVVDYTIPAFHAIPRPPAMDGLGRDPEHRVFPELTTFRVTAGLLWVGLMQDEDFHMAIADPADPTKVMTVEAPAPDCVPASLAQAMVDIRSSIEQITGILTPGTTKYFNPPRKVIVTGIPYWDMNHGQSGQGPNYLELHPVLNIRFPVACALPASRAVNICLPVANSTVKSSVRVVAAAKGTAVSGLNVLLDGVHVYSNKSNTVDTNVTVTKLGSHRITVTATDSAGNFWKTVYMTVQ